MFTKIEPYILNRAKLPSWLLVVFSGFYLTRLVPISPVYFSFTLSFIIFIWGSMAKGKRQLHVLTIPVFAYLLYLLVSQPFNNPDLFTLLNVLFSLTYLITILNTANQITRTELIRISKMFIIFTILLLSVEATWRLSHPVDLANMMHNKVGSNETEQLFLQTPNNVGGFSLTGNSEVEKNLFYTFKISSIMFQDSNFVGTYGLTTFFFYLFLLREKIVSSSIPLFILGFLIMLTLSRSAIITIPLTFLLIAITKKNSPIVYKIIFLFILFVGTIVIFNSVSTDDSFLSKIRIITLSSNHLNHLSIVDLINGIGYGNAVNYLGIGAHNIFLTHLIESGIIGFIFFLITNLMFIKGSDRKSLYLTIPLFISGMSLSGHVLTFYYACLTILYLLSRNHPAVSTEVNKEASMEASR